MSSMDGDRGDFDDDHDRDEGFPDEDPPFQSENNFSDDGRYQDDMRFPDDRYPDDSPVHKHDDRYPGPGPRHMRMMRLVYFSHQLNEDVLTYVCCQLIGVLFFAGLNFVRDSRVATGGTHGCKCMVAVGMLLYL